MTRPIGRVVHLNNQHLLMSNNPLVAWANGERAAPPALDAGVLTAAFTLLTAYPDSREHDPLASLVTGIPPGPRGGRE